MWLLFVYFGSITSFVVPSQKAFNGSIASAITSPQLNQTRAQRENISCLLVVCCFKCQTRAQHQREMFRIILKFFLVSSSRKANNKKPAPDTKISSECLASRAVSIKNFSHTQPPLVCLFPKIILPFKSMIEACFAFDLQIFFITVYVWNFPQRGMWKCWGNLTRIPMILRCHRSSCARIFAIRGLPAAFVVWSPTDVRVWGILASFWSPRASLPRFDSHLPARHCCSACESAGSRSCLLSFWFALSDELHESLISEFRLRLV